MEASWKVHERRVAEGFSRWLSGGACARVMARESMLGRMIECKYGDLAPHPDCPEEWRPAAKWFSEKFQVDAKRRKAFSLDALARSAAHPFWAWMRKLKDDSGGKFAVLVAAVPGGRGLAAYGDRLSLTLRDVYGYTAPVLVRRSETVSVAPFAEWLAALGPPEALGCPARRTVHA